MKRLVFRVVAIMCIAAISAAMLSGCGYPGYRGENADAYTLICNQVPDIMGARRVLLTLRDPQIIAVERDGEGRLLFLYLEDRDEMVSCGIVQKSDGEKVFIVCGVEISDEVKITQDTRRALYIGIRKN